MSNKVVPFKQKSKPVKANKNVNIPQIEDLSNIAFMIGEDAPVLLNKYKVSNMDVEAYIVPEYTVLKILEMYHLPQDKQMQAINDLVDREVDWLDYDDDMQLNKIKKALIDETVFNYLNETLFESGYTQVTVALDAEGSIIIELFYIKEDNGED